MGLWDQIRDALGTVWADWRGPGEDERTQRIAWLTEAWRVEQSLSSQIRQIIPAIAYEQFRRRLDGIARDDAQHASLVQERLEALGGGVGEALKAGEGSENSLLSGPWRRLQRILTAKRALYEGYRQQAVAVDDPELRSLLERLRDGEAHHQEQLLEMLIRLDAHVHETMA